jgi:IclR family acetate operon transcriptional repressor
MTLEIRSVTKAIRLLNMLGDGSGHFGVSELARLVEMDKSSVSRMLRTLEQAGFVEQDPLTQRYALGLNIGVLGYKALRRMDLRSASRPLLERLAETTNECAHMAILADGRAFYVDQASPGRGIGIDAPIGTLAPLYCTALGKALLAFQLEADREDMIQKLSFEPFTRRTVTGPEALKEQLARVRTSHVAYDDEEFSIGVRCMAAPVFRYDGAVVGAIGVSGPSPRVTDARISEWEPTLLEIAKELSARLGWDGSSQPDLSPSQKKKPSKDLQAAS